jgi:hypothetical protein
LFAGESSHDFGRTWLRRLDHRRVNRCLVSTECAPSPQNDHSWCNSESSGASMVVLQHATESFSALDLTSDGTDSFLWIDEMVAQTLMVSARRDNARRNPAPPAQMTADRRRSYDQGTRTSDCETISPCRRSSCDSSVEQNTDTEVA